MITIRRGSILEAQTDYIVNPANSFLRHDGGLAKVIEDAAAPNAARYPDRPEMWKAIDREWLVAQLDAPLVATGNAYMTTAGALPYKGVVHAVGPIWNGGAFMERPLLFSAVTEAFVAVQGAGGKSVAFPAISCGVFGYPLGEAARTMLSALGYAQLSVEVWLLDENQYNVFKALCTDA